MPLYDKSLGEELKRKGRQINLEESKLWTKVVDGVSEINKNNKSSSDFLQKNEIEQIPSTRTYIKTSIKTQKVPPDINFNPQIVIDKKVFAKLKKGQIEPEKKLDLHGMNFNKANKAVLSFIIQSSRENIRVVLIITGKGQTNKKNDRFFLERSSVTLKNALPEWLSVDPLKHLILNFTLAHKSHGGEGAYYVYLKRNRHYKT